MSHPAKALIVGSDMITPYGRGTLKTWEGLMSGRCAIRDIERFPTSAFKAKNAGIVEGLEYHADKSLVMQMLEGLLRGVSVPSDTRLYLATTKGEIDLLEKALLAHGSDAEAALSNPAVLLGKLRRMLSLEDDGRLVSAACASGSAALAMAASDVSAGRAGTALVVACDSVTEFVYSGFSSLMAIDSKGARPFDAKRTGLSVGEAAAYALLSSPERAAGMGTATASVSVSGWGMSSDANHMTGPSRDGRGLWVAIRKAMDMAGGGPDDICSVSAHGTGTMYNDSMEMKALRLAFGDNKRPVYSVKGGMGHSMGAAGLVEALLAARSISESTVPPTVGMTSVDDEARGWASPDAKSLNGKGKTLTTNSGFGGINAALVLEAA
jgi:3-oxoacyl-[acyl-carrier-protein] synthase II